MAEKKKEDKKKVEDEKPETAEGAEGAEGAAEGAGKKKFPLKLALIIGGVVLLLGGVAAALVFTGVLGGKKAEPTEAHGEEGADTEKVAEEKPDAHGGGGKGGGGHGGGGGKGGAVFYDVGEIVVNLQGDGRRQTFLKLVVQLELENEDDKTTIENIKPRIVDNFQTYLRELRLDDLRGSAGLYRLREELLFRVTEAAHPVKIRDVLFQQMLIQ